MPEGQSRQKLSQMAINEVVRLAKEGAPLDPAVVAEQLLGMVAPERKESAQDVVRHMMGARSEPALYYLPGLCECDDHRCVATCPVGALEVDTNGAVKFNRDACVDCGACVEVCGSGAFGDRSEVLPVLEMVRRPGVHAIIAPAFAGQWDVPSGKIATALRRLGFSGVYEVAFGADVTTIMEAREFQERMRRGDRFLITSCCCPAFVKLVERHRPKIANLVSDTVSPMVMMGRLLKKKHPGCKVVFIGPCLAKKAEASLTEFLDAVDAVITFKELSVILDGFGIDPVILPETDLLAQSSACGRSYARTGGVTGAIERAARRESGGPQVRALTGDGLHQCSAILSAIEDGTADGNFMEGMACPGGCIGGPGTVTDVSTARDRVEAFSSKSVISFSFDNDEALAVADERPVSLLSTKAPSAKVV